LEEVVESIYPSVRMDKNGIWVIPKDDTARVPRRVAIWTWKFSLDN
jgi:hypothetical protein